MQLFLTILIANLFYWPSHRNNDQMLVTVIKAIIATFIAIKMAGSIATMTRLHNISYVVMIFEIAVLIMLTKPEKT